MLHINTAYCNNFYHSCLLTILEIICRQLLFYLAFSIDKSLQVQQGLVQSAHYVESPEILLQILFMQVIFKIYVYLGILKQETIKFFSQNIRKICFPLASTVLWKKNGTKIFVGSFKVYQNKELVFRSNSLCSLRIINF